MKAQKSHQRLHHTARFTVSLVETLLVLLLLSAMAPRSTAKPPQDNRQLSRDQVQPKGASERRVALVIGNGTYTNAPPLKNPPNDARDMAATLKTLGFEVANGINVNQRDMKRLIREFGQKLKAGGSGLFYYAGHGVQSNGRNYLIPVEADIQSEAEVEDSSVDVSLVLKYMDEAQNGLNIVILDACRNNPFARSFRSASSGLAQVDAPTGTLIAYATAPGRVASDGTGQNGLYTSELLRQMRVPGLSATDVFMQVRGAVMKQTGNKQVPWEASSLVGRFYFNAPTNAEGVSQPAVGERKGDSEAFELSYWETIKNSNDPEDFRSYLRKYPDGQFAELAKRRAASRESVAGSSNPSETKNSDKTVSGDSSLFGQSQAALDKGDVDSAIALLNRSTAAEPQLAKAWELLTIAYLRRAASSSDQSRADADYLNAVRAGESLVRLRMDPEYVTLFAQALISAHQFARAASELEKVSSGADTKALTLYLLGVSHSRARNFTRAIAALERAAAKTPDDVNIYRELGYAYEISTQYRKALHAYEKGAQLAPSDADFHASIARVRPYAK